MQCSLIKAALLAVLSASCMAVSAQEGEGQDIPKSGAELCAEAENETGVASCTVGGRVLFLPEYFSQFNPVTALDLVRRVPGFSIDAGESVRGFGGAAGNVLIDSQRPSTKSASIFDVLGRIPVASVDRIELIRGGTGGLDVGGQAVVVNVVQKNGEGASSITWEAAVRVRHTSGDVRPRGSIAYNTQIAGTKITAGLNAFGFATDFGGEETILRFNGPDESRDRDGRFRNQGGGANFSAEREFANGDIARLRFEGAYNALSDDVLETRRPVGGPVDEALFTFPLNNLEYEVSADFEHGFTEYFGIKIIGLFGREQEDFDSGFLLTPGLGDTSQSIFSSSETSGETIGRVEFDWKKWQRHAVQFGGELASTFVESEAQLFQSDDTGALIPVEIVGANTRVSELRGEVFVTDSWKASEKLTVDLGFTMELSRIAQSGDTANSRFFTYPKPSVILTYAQTPKTRWRLAAMREVNQLSFGQFISSVNFDDEDVDFGNPDLQPQREWQVEGSYERRFGAIGVIEIIGFYNYIQDVEDLLPLDGIVEVPGNIGDGQIYGARANITLPLDYIGLRNGRLDAEVTGRNSIVTDPVTGEERPFSFTPDYFYELEFRQDFPKHKLSWGFEVEQVGREFGFGLDEFTTNRFETEYAVYVETTAIKGIRLRLRAGDLANSARIRDRTVFNGSRALNIPLLQERRDNRNGGGVSLTASGTF